MNKLKLITIIISATILLTACQDKEAGKLENRVLALWNHKINKEYRQAYEFTTPGYKKITSQEAYTLKVSSSQIIWTGIKFVKKECSKPDLCRVELLVKYKYKLPTGMAGSKKMEVETPKKEKWLLKNNIWYVVVK